MRPACRLFWYSALLISSFLVDLLHVLNICSFFFFFSFYFFHLLVFVQWPNCTLLLLLASEETSPAFSVHATWRGLFPPSSLCIAGWPRQFQKEQAFWEILWTWSILSCVGKGAFQSHLVVFEGMFLVNFECWNTKQACGGGGGHFRKHFRQKHWYRVGHCPHQLDKMQKVTVGLFSFARARLVFCRNLATEYYNGKGKEEIWLYGQLCYQCA